MSASCFHDRPANFWTYILRRNPQQILKGKKIKTSLIIALEIWTRNTLLFLLGLAEFLNIIMSLTSRVKISSRFVREIPIITADKNQGIQLLHMNSFLIFGLLGARKDIQVKSGNDLINFSRNLNRFRNYVVKIFNLTEQHRCGRGLIRDGDGWDAGEKTI